METFNIPVLVIFGDGLEELRHYEVEAWSMSQAIELAKERALEDEEVVEVKGQVR